MTKVILVRHGQTKWNLEGKYQGNSDTELTTAGIEQAKKLGERLFYEKIAAVYSSDLNRAFQTARYIAFDRGLHVEKVPGLREISFGEWEGLTYEEIHARWSSELQQLFANADVVKIPSGETVHSVAERVVNTIQELVEKHTNETILLVSHGMAIRCALAAFMHVPLKYVWNIRQDNTAVNTLAFYGEQVIVELLNDTHHLK